MICMAFIPTMNGIPQKIGILRFYKGINSKNGPGQRPPIPHPMPNRADPMTIFQSIFPLGSESFVENMGFLLN